MFFAFTTAMNDQKTAPLQRTLTMTWLTCLLALTLSTVSHVSHAKALQSHDSIREFAQEYVEAQITDRPGKVTTEAARLDPRLRLAQCDEELEVANSFDTLRGGQITVNVQCNGSKRWTLYVPVKLQVLQEVVVINQSLPRNTVIGADHVRLEIQDTSRLTRGFFTDLSQVVGKSIQRRISANRVLTPHSVQSPDAVKRGQKVTLVAKNNGFSVSMHGKALSNGAVGDRIKVQNLSSERIIEGIITKDGQVATQL